MFARKFALLASVGLLCQVGIGHAEGGSPPETFPLSKVRRGLKGHGMTTMKGTTPERFEFEVIGVAKNFLPKMDIILVKSDDPKLKITGFWQGMSGSPLFIDGKVLCAFSYGFRFNKVSIGGCTPIEYMKREGFKAARRLRFETETRRPAKHSRRGKAPEKRIASTVASVEEWLALAPERTAQSALDKLGGARQPWLLRAPVPPGPKKPAGSRDGNGMEAAAVPLALSGFTTSAFEEAKKIMANYPVEPMQGGGSGSPNEGPHEFEMGGSISVQLIRGDMSAAATGTVSFVEKNRVLAFGHPFMQAGELYAPVATARVLTVIPSAFSAFVMASPMREIGALIHDRQSTIMADTNLKTRMIPVHITIDGSGAEKATFNVEIMNNRFFSGTLAGLAAMNAVSLYLPDRDHITVRMQSKVSIRGHEPLSFTDYLYSATGASGAVAGARGLRVMVPLLLNPFSPVEIDRVDIDVSVSYDTNYGIITALRLPSSELEPGSRSHVLVDLTHYKGQTITERVPFDVPESLAGSLVKLEVTPGDSAALNAAPPKSVDDLIRAFRSLLPGDVYAVTLFAANEGAAVNGKLVRDLPSSALDRFKRGSTTPRTSIYRPISRSVFKTKRVLSGKQSILIKIADAD